MLRSSQSRTRSSRTRALSSTTLVAAVTTAATATFLLTPVQEARASGLDAPVIGHEQSSPSARDSAGVYWNPGQLGFLDRSEVIFGGALVIPVISYQRYQLSTYQTADSLHYTAQSAIDAGAIDPSRTQTHEKVSSSFPVAATGNIFFAVPVIKDRLTIGGGVYAPSAVILKMPKMGPQRFQVQEAMILAGKPTLSLAVKAADFLSIGAGVSYVLGFAELSKVQDFAAVDVLGDGLENLGQPNDFGADAPTEVRELDTLARPLSIKNAWSHMVTFNAGIAAQPTKRFGINLAYEHSTPMKFKGDVAVDMVSVYGHDDTSFFTDDLAGQGVSFPRQINGDVVLEFMLPKRLTLGAAFDINEKYRLDGFVQMSFYGQVESFDVTMTSPDLVQEPLGLGDTAVVSLKRDWNHTVWAEGAFRMRITDRLLGSGSFGYMSPVSPDSTVDLASIDGHRLLGALGLGFDVNEKWTVYGDARFQGILPREVTESEYDLGNGVYRLFIATLGLHLRKRF